MADNLQRVDGRKLGFKLPIWYRKDGKKKFSYPMNCNNTYRNRTKYTGLCKLELDSTDQIRHRA